MYFVYVCSCGNAQTNFTQRNLLKKMKCKICEKTTTISVKRESNKKNCLYKGEDFNEALYARRVWQERRKQK